MMGIDTPDGAITAVIATIPGASNLKLVASRIEGYAGYWYVSMQDDGGSALVGGSAFVVVESSGNVHEVSGSRPPRLNLARVAATD